MLKQRIILILAALAAIGAVLALVLRPAPEPEYQGQKLSQWVIHRGSATQFVYYSFRSNPQFDEAVHKMGTNALPYLIEWIGYETPRWKTYVLPVATRILGNTRWAFAEQEKASLRRFGAELAFRQLAAYAAPEIGKLSRIANDPKRSESRLSAISALADIGVAALPAIVGVLTNEQSRPAKSPEIRIRCASYLIRNRDSTTAELAELAEPALRSMCEDTNVRVRSSATNALFRLKQRAQLRKAGKY